MRSSVGRQVAVPAILMIIFTVFALGGCAGRNLQAGGSPASTPAAALEDIWGVRDISIRLATNGYILDFRYHVTDPQKARPLFDSRTKPYLVDVDSGARFYVPSTPKVGSMRSTRPPKANKTYFILFGNPGMYLKHGSRVTVVVGDFRAENLVVQ